MDGGSTPRIKNLAGRWALVVTTVLLLATAVLPLLTMDDQNAINGNGSEETAGLMAWGIVSEYGDGTFTTALWGSTGVDRIVDQAKTGGTDVSGSADLAFYGSLLFFVGLGLWFVTSFMLMVTQFATPTRISSILTILAGVLVLAGTVMTLVGAFDLADAVRDTSFTDVDVRIHGAAFTAPLAGLAGIVTGVLLWRGARYDSAFQPEPRDVWLPEDADVDRLRCPRCKAANRFVPGQERVCAYCGFNGPINQSPLRYQGRASV